MAGIIGNTIDSGNITYRADTSKYDPTLRTVDEGNETVAGQLSKILSSGSPYLQRAQSNALDTANDRGLLNTSMAAGAGTAAAIDAALPVATADASTHTTAARDNQGFSNTAGQVNAAAENTANLNEANAANTSSLSTQQTGQQRELIGTQTGAQKELAQQAADIQTGQVLPATTAAQKEVQAQTGEIQSGLSAQQASQTLNLLTAQGQEQSRLQEEASNQKIQQLTAAGQQDQALQVLKGSQAVSLANIEATYKNLMQTSASSGQLFTQISKNIADILADPNTTVEQKQTAVNNQSALLQSSLAVLGGIGNVDLGGLLDFTPTAGGTTTNTAGTQTSGVAPTTGGGVQP